MLRNLNKKDMALGVLGLVLVFGTGYFIFKLYKKYTSDEITKEQKEELNIQITRTDN
jgi:uncharacterized Tic20 family protein